MIARLTFNMEVSTETFPLTEVKLQFIAPILNVHWPICMCMVVAWLTKVSGQSVMMKWLLNHVIYKFYIIKLIFHLLFVGFPHFAYRWGDMFMHLKYHTIISYHIPSSIYGYCQFDIQANCTIGIGMFSWSGMDILWVLFFVFVLATEAVHSFT